VERKFATLWSRVRSDLNAAKFPKRMRHGLWSECARHATDIENLLVTENKKELGPSYRQFYGSDWAGVEYLHQFGEMGVIKTARKIQNKLENKGTTMIYCGRAVNHGADVHRFFNERTKRIIMSRDVQWLKKVYGDWKGGLSKAKKKQRVEYIEVDVPSGNDGVPTGNGAVPPVNDEDSDDLEEEVLADPVESDDESFDEVRDNEEVGMEEEPKGSPARTLPIRSGQKQMFQSPARVRGMVKQLKETRMSDSPIIGTMNARTLRSGTKTRQPTEGANLVFETVSEFAMKAGAAPLSDENKSEEPIDYEKIDPSRYKDIFECPKTFEEAWNHPCPFQRKMWRAAILKELEKMLQLKVWVKIKRDMMPRNRRCVKYKWVLEIKRDGRFRARLVACGYSQVGGVDFTEVFSPVVNDTSFRLWLIWSMIYRKKRLVFDIDVAFLNGDLEEEIFMDCPKGLEHEDDECLLLKRTIYGLVQSARMYNLKFRDILLKLGYKQCACEPCLFYRANKLGVTMLVSYVDDNAIAGDEAAIEDTLKGLNEHGLTYTRESLTDYLSCEVIFNDDETKAWIGQPHMVKKLKKEFWEEVKGMKTYEIPGTPNQGLVRV